MGKLEMLIFVTKKGLVEKELKNFLDTGLKLVQQ